MSRVRRDRRRGCVCPGKLRSLHKRRGAFVVELALLLPLLALLFVIATDVGRVFYYSLTLQNCARAGALYASDTYVADESPFMSAEEAARADATDLSPPPTITTKNGTDADGRSYVEVTATYSFSSITHVPGIPQEMDLTRSVHMYRSAIIPDID